MKLGQVQWLTDCNGIAKVRTHAHGVVRFCLVFGDRSQYVYEGRLFHSKFQIKKYMNASHRI